MLGLGEARHASVDAWNADLDDMVLSAVKQLTDLGTSEAVEIRGKYFRNILDDDIEIFTEQIPPSRLADFRWFDTLDDSLYRGLGLAWGENRRELRYPPRDDRHYRFVTVKQSDLRREFPATLVVETDPFTNAEIDHWIHSTPHTGMKVARRAFMSLKSAKGLSAAFEMRWNAIKQNKVGRPRAQ